jgi:DNA-directed RNA polymerase subunit RPC12/RpoP
MESKYHKYKYKWSTLSVIVDCTKCGNNIVLQNFEGNPECNDCGNINKLSWDHIIREINILAMKKADSKHKTIMGGFNGKVLMDDADTIPCYHCKQSLALPEQEELDNYSCNNCSQKVDFKEYEGLDELVFYRAGSEIKDTAGVQMIAVRCVSCGAPLEADPTKNNFHCKFCSTENILPMSLRYKVVLDDLFVGLRNSKYLKLAAFETDGTRIEQTLRDNGKASFEDAELDCILIKNKNDIGIYKQIIDEFKYLPSDKILRELFSTSINATLINSVGQRLQKSEEEIDERIQLSTGASPKKATIKTSKTPVESTRPKTAKFKTPFMIVLMIVFVLTIIAMVNLLIN